MEMADASALPTAVAAGAIALGLLYPAVASSLSPFPLDRKAYLDGKPRPFFRGVLHGLVSAVLVVAIAGVAAALQAGKLPWRCWGFVAFLLGKLASYATSALLHLYPFQTLEALTASFKWDLACVTVSVWSSSANVAVHNPSEFLASVLIHAAVNALNFVLVSVQLGDHKGLETLDSSTDAPRMALLVVQFCSTMYHIGWHYGFKDYWLAALGFYVAAFAISAPVTANHEVEPVSSWCPWHKAGRNGLHEDMHLLIFAGDVAMALLGLRMMMDPSIDANPTVGEFVWWPMDQVA
mmetsp:Transcript_32419/g.103000  ORF Transcript_32419/g.103000 Transcript_32419/m.103000 type:complete len:294 (-) Transcript_32419:1241-2122(-)|eukprot:CAMPEP_0118865536 /NCGR_PEP_ID=MMETSP1163-20130328/9763_1 /TAXON_ID=124430 /ORGANISM="Phaeomonas parva, Strain CCMP2877" /LENGTH=293 /DNA_ID=CAMNT_0006799769 /DNA_START=86 /DNA_END=967 /DNA_ORIENTATION=+